MKSAANGPDAKNAPLEAAPARPVLALDGVPRLRGLTQPMHRASGPLATARAVRELKPEVIVIDGKAEWQRDFVATLPSERRPAIVAIDGEPDAMLLDEWLESQASVAAMAKRVRLAKDRAVLRRRSARRVYVDALTGLPNRRASVRALLREAERSRRVGGGLSLVLIDLDDFKAVNEREGHPGGDRLLRKVGAALRKSARGTELCGRIGGDEFALVIPAGVEVARRATARVKQALRAVGVSASAAACALGPDERLRELYRRTDRELTFAKEEHRREVREQAEKTEGGVPVYAS